MFKSSGNKTKSRNCSCWVFSLCTSMSQCGRRNKTSHYLPVIPEAAAIILSHILGEVQTENTAQCLKNYLGCGM